jgi:hypothetical protein
VSAELGFVLVNESTTTDPAQGGPLTTSLLQQIAADVEMQLNAEYANEWGGAYMVRAAPATDVDPAECAVIIRDAFPEVPDAAGWHQTLPNGAPVIYVARLGSNSLTSGGQALSVTISHECIETAGDRNAATWVDDGAGHEFALEMCDACESFYYTGPTSCSLSDFLLRAFFTTGAPGPYSHLGNCTAPLTTAGAGGGDYQLVRAVKEQGVQQVTARGVIHPARMAKKRHVSSRSYKRGLRI